MNIYTYIYKYIYIHVKPVLSMRSEPHRSKQNLWTPRKLQTVWNPRASLLPESSLLRGSCLSLATPAPAGGSGVELRIPVYLVIYDSD